ncbi:pilus assembly protein CpaF [Acetoanaerobium pronyense]|uniref:Pilus assembly protein CpaF n=1 Tax=Acetoanaerobium pronyense TaxID=1482736 RepID=A0ABS4KKM4_9FIRM|nr:CpaF family protein [Acetoanaerobium pronyense]MBP2028299.1 pilus assembly protein CpaF [Acetoanaerobium pronyense]
MALIDRLKKQELEEIKSKEAPFPVVEDNSDKMYQVTLKLQEKLVKHTEKKELNSVDIREKLQDFLQEILEEDNIFLTHLEKEETINAAYNDITGYGPITGLIKDDAITEVMINGPYDVYIEKEGKLEKTKVRFKDTSQLMKVIEKIVAPIGRRIDESSPMVDARLPDGSRINAIIPPLALDGPILTIRKFAKDPYTDKDLIDMGTMNVELMEFLKAAVKARLNILVSGGTGSGKTTTLNVISSFIPDDERIVSIEDAAELQLHQEHVVRLESRPPNIEGKGEIVIRDLVRNALRMRPDRIIVGEVRSGEALDMLQAMNTGHDGSITTGHANSPRDMLARLETMVLMAGMDLPLKAIREQIASAIDIIVHQSRLKDGTRKVVSVMEVQGMEEDIITLQEIFKIHIEGKDTRGRLKTSLRSTGIKPKVLQDIKDAGIFLDESIFS